MVDMKYFWEGYEDDVWREKGVIIISDWGERKEKNERDWECGEKRGGVLCMDRGKEEEGWKGESVWNERCKWCEW